MTHPNDLKTPGLTPFSYHSDRPLFRVSVAMVGQIGGKGLLCSPAGASSLATGYAESSDQAGASVLCLARNQRFCVAGTSSKVLRVWRAMSPSARCIGWYCPWVKGSAWSL